MSTFAERKAERTRHYEKYVKGWKKAPCGACAGSGHYDHDGSPPCGSCGGSGTERVPPQVEWVDIICSKCAGTGKTARSYETTALSIDRRRKRICNECFGKGTIEVRRLTDRP